MANARLPDEFFEKAGGTDSGVQRRNTSGARPIVEPVSPRRATHRSTTWATCIRPRRSGRASDSRRPRRCGGGWIASAPSRSAIVRATRRTLSWARAERPSSSIARLEQARAASGLSVQYLRTCRGVIRPLTPGPLPPNRSAWRARASRTSAEEVGRGRAGRGLGELGEGDGGDLDVQVDPVEQRAGDPAQVLLDLRAACSCRPAAGRER